MLKKLITISSLLMLSTFGFSQTVDQLKKENQKLKSDNEQLKLTVNDLKAKVDFCNAIDKNKDVQVKSFTDFYDVKVLKCKGNKGEQSVTIEIILNQSKVNQKFSANANFLAYDNLGNSYEIKSVSLGITDLSYTFNSGSVPTNVPVKMTVKFINILPGTDSFSIVNLPVVTSNSEGGGNRTEGIIELRNLKIEW